jgi:hypothetical protein
VTRWSIPSSLIAGCAAWWLRSEHVPSEALHVAQAFVAHLDAKEFAQAYELTAKGGYVGKTPAELEVVARRQLCKITRVAGTFPFQSNGNRVRRWASGREIEMPEISVEFVGSCLLGVTVRHSPTEGWRVFKFASHAG